MAEQFNNKDYGDYFSAVEKSIEKNNNSEKPKKIENDFKPTQNHQPKPIKKAVRVRAWVYMVPIVLVVAIILTVIFTSAEGDSPQLLGDTVVNSATSEVKVEEKPPVNYYAEYDDSTAALPSSIAAQNVIVINCDTNKVVAARNASERCYPASTTKVMTILTACDYITDYNKTFTFSYEITDPFHREGATMAGFADGEAVNMTDLLYGAILPSGADATAGLAIAVAGSEEEFANLMNKKADQLGLKNTHFTNASGLFDKDHYTTPEDMAVIIREAMKNDLCKEVLSTYQYTTAKTTQHPNGAPLTSTLFSYMYGTEPEGSDILGGKTGFVNESGYCIASFGQSDGGTNYVCVTFRGAGLWPTVYDQINLYTRYAK